MRCSSWNELQIDQHNKEPQNSDYISRSSNTNGVLVVASTAGSEHMVFAYKGFVRGFAHTKGDHGKQGIEQPTNLDQNAVCETTGESSPIDSSCTNTATTDTTNTGGIGTVQGSTGDDKKQTIEQPTIIGGAVCETTGESSPIDSSCTNTATTDTTNTGGIGTGTEEVQATTKNKRLNNQPLLVGQYVKLLVKALQLIQSCTNTATTDTTNTGGIGTVPRK